ncbi:MAG: hypothetical protein ACD_62C00509G0002 [uncultured bacterium]|nr:MAG: hypothetical protein ACD_62C00509G0002 [uncultured bacterium]HLD45157.1 N-acetyltransferase [bacterium]
MISIIPVSHHKQKKAFINFPYSLYQNDPHWVPPLKLERQEFLDPKKNPFFLNAEGQLFLALREDQVVGRISAHINHLHNERYSEKTGHFGLFDAIDDGEVARALFDAVCEWHGKRGMTQIAGPFNLSVNEETGLLIDGFESSPFPLMAHNYPYYQKLIEDQGFTKLKDLFAWAYSAERPVPEQAQQIADVVKTYPGLTVREVNMRHLKKDVAIIRDVFNSAWSKNWGFIPWTEEELGKIAKDLKLILNPKLALIAEVDGQPAAISIAFPNYHEAIKDLKGRLFPFGIFKLIYRLKTNKIKTARLALLGIKKEFRHDILAGLSVYLYSEMHRRGQALGLTGGELSWTLEDNEKINRGIELMGGKVYKKYRVYGKPI